MLTYVPFEQLTEEHLKLIAESMLACPQFWRPEGDATLRALFKGEASCFAFDGGLMILSCQFNPELNKRRLLIDTWAGDGSIFHRKELADALRRIAADWECDTIETLVFDTRLADAICSIGGSVESVCVTLPVERPT